MDEKKDQGEPHPDFRNLIQKDYQTYLLGLFQEALKGNPFGFICTILRVSGVSYGHWDPLEEIRQAFDDFQILINRSAAEKNNEKMALRVGLLMYCHAIEITAIHEILINLLRCKKGENFTIKPFLKWSRPKKKSGSLFSIPPSATTKFTKIKEYASSVNEIRLQTIINEFFDDRIRNAFSHSDYCLTDTEFRWTEGGPASAINLTEVHERITRAFAFYEELFRLLNYSKKEMAAAHRFHKWPNYEVMELLSENDTLHGFKIHFSNGSSAYYTRKMGQVEAVNMFFEKDGSVNFMCGQTDTLDPIWKVNGVPVTDWDKLNMRNSEPEKNKT